jgi:hypothetical protein
MFSDNLQMVPCVRSSSSLQISAHAISSASVTNSTEHGPTWEANIRSSGQDIPLFLGIITAFSIQFVTGPYPELDDCSP